MKIKRIFSLASFLLLVMFTSFALQTKGERIIAPQPSRNAFIEINYKKPIYDTPTLIFKIRYNGIIVIHYNWTDRIGHSCNALWLNFWDHAELSAEEQERTGNLGNLWLTKCSNNHGTYNITINSKNSQTLTGIYFEVDNDLGFTGVQQDPLFLEVFFYPFEGQINFYAIYVPIAIGNLVILAVIVILTTRIQKP